MSTYDEEIMKDIDYETFLNIISNIPSCIYFKDTDLKYRFSSHKWEQLNSANIVGKTDLEVRKDTENALIAQESDRRIIKTGKGECYIIRSDLDKLTFLELNKEPVFDSNGKVLGVVGLINNITETKVMEQKLKDISTELEKQCSELEKSNTELKETLDKVENMHSAQRMFTASMNHELRSPLNGIIGLLQLLSEDEKLDDTQREYINNAYDSSKMMLDIVNDLLDHAKMEMSEFEIHNDAFDIRNVIKQVGFSAEKLAAAKGLKLIMNVGYKVPESLVGDELRIRQIITNLISNGIKYTEEGMVSLDVDYDAGILTIKCSDTGQGISKDALDVLFVPFVRLDEKKNAGIQGTGLGLSIVKKMIEKMGGDIKVSSEVNAGTVFTATIPLSSDEEAKALLVVDSLNVNGSDVNNLSNYSVLCVDDTKINLMVFEGLLKDTGIKIDKAFSGEEGIKKASENKYDIIFLDHMMPKIDGMEAFKQIKEKGINRDTPTVIMTANAGDGYEREYAGAGFDGYISKPFLKDDLCRMICELINSRVE